MSTPVSTPLQGPLSLPLARPTAVVMLRTPIPPSQGTDPYHDTFGPFCLPSFPLSALESGSSTPLPPALAPGMAGAEHLKSALAMSATGKRRGRWIEDDTTLTTHHLAKDDSGETEFCVTSIPILGHRIMSIEELAARIVDGRPSQATSTSKDGMELDEAGGKGGTTNGGPPSSSGGGPYRGVIITSQRAVEAWGEAALWAAKGPGKDKAPVNNWPRTPFFAVGPATSAALRNLSPQLLQPFRPSLVMGGGATGTGEALANYIIRHFNGMGGPASRPPGPGSAEADNDEEPAAPPPLLLLVGDKNAPTIPNMLSSASPPIPCEELQVYETCLDSQFSYNCSSLAKSLPPPSSRPGSRRPSRSGSAGSTRRPSMASISGGERRPSVAGFAAAVAARTAAQAQAQANAGAQREDTDGSGALGAIGSAANIPVNLAGAVAAGRDRVGSLSAMTPVSATNTPSTANSSGGGLNNASGSSTSSSALAESPVSEDIELPLDSDIGLGTGPGTKPDWLVFFSPSGVNYALEVLRSRSWLPPAECEAKASDCGLSAGPPEGYPRIAVLGPTTKRWVKDNLGWAPDAVAASPGPSELRDAIRVAEKRIRNERERFKERRRKEREERESGGGPREKMETD